MIYPAARKPISVLPRFGYQEPPRKRELLPPPERQPQPVRRPQPKPPLTPLEKAQRTFNRIVLATVLAVGGLMGTGHYLQARTVQEVNQLESALGSSFMAVENPDGSVSVILSPFEIPANVIESSAPASVKVQLLRNGYSQSHGSGVVIRDAEGHFYVLTNHHVVEDYLSGERDGIRLLPYRQPGVVLMADVVRLPDGSPAVSPAADVALLRITDPEFQPAHFIDLSRLRDLDAHPLDENEPVFSVGNPGGDSHTILPGIAFEHSSTRGQAIEYLQACFHGSSGSPVFDAEGRLIGLNKSVSIPARGRCWGVSAEQLQELLQRWQVKLPPETRE